MTLYEFERRPRPPRQTKPARAESLLDRLRREYRPDPLGEYRVADISWRDDGVVVRLEDGYRAREFSLSNLIDYQVRLPAQTL